MSAPAISFNSIKQEIKPLVSKPSELSAKYAELSNKMLKEMTLEDISNLKGIEQVHTDLVDMTINKAVYTFISDMADKKATTLHLENVERLYSEKKLVEAVSVLESIGDPTFTTPKCKWYSVLALEFKNLGKIEVAENLEQKSDLCKKQLATP